MNRLSTILFILICAHAHNNACILLNTAERLALQRQHQLIKDIRERLLVPAESQDANLPTEELLSKQCHTLPRHELSIIATVIAAYKNNMISERATASAMHNAHQHNSAQCEQLAQFWQATHAIAALENKRVLIFEDEN